MTLADAIRVHVLNGDTDLANHKAVLAVVDKCEAMRAEADRQALGNGLWAHAIADEFESVIARELGIEV